MQRHFSHVSEDEAEAVVVLEDANGLVVCEAVEGAAIDLADLVARLECVILRVNTGKPMRVSHLVGKSMATANVRRWSREIGIF